MNAACFKSTLDQLLPRNHATPFALFRRWRSQRRPHTRVRADTGLGVKRRVHWLTKINVRLEQVTQRDVTLGGRDVTAVKASAFNTDIKRQQQQQRQQQCGASGTEGGQATEHMRAK